MCELEWRRKISRPDGECSSVALKTAVRDAVPEVEMISQESSVGDHAASGEAKRQDRVLKNSVKKSNNNMSSRSHF